MTADREKRFKNGKKKKGRNSYAETLIRIRGEKGG